MDTNAVIDYLGNRLPSKSESLMDNLPPLISVITRIEWLGWYQINSEQNQNLQSFIDNSTIYNLEEHVILKTIQLRQKHKIKIPDAIIAATALTHNFILITNNEKDFKDINGLKILNPWK